MQRSTHFLAILTGVGLAAAPAQAQWSTGSPLSAPRNELAAVSVGDLAFFAGGLNVQVTSDVVDIYDSASDTWTVVHLSIPRGSLAATAVGPYVLFAGGAVDGTTETAVVDVFDTQTMDWSQPASLTQARFYLAATTVGSKAIFAGGGTGGVNNPNSSPSDVVDIYDASKGPPWDSGAWSTTKLIEARGGCAAATAGSHALFAGGFNGVSYSATVDVYDDSTDQWHVKTLVQPRGFRSANSAAAVGSLAYFGGGEIGAGIMSDVVDVYDAQSGSWKTPLQLSSARGALAATALGNTVLFAGGVEDGFVPSATVDLLNSGTGQWTSAALSQPRARLCAATVGGKSLFAGGTSGFGSPHAVVDVYEPVGLNYCEATTNSTGCAASISATGSSSLAANDLVLSSACVPDGIYIYFHATIPLQVPFGDGFLCAGGNVVRIVPAGVASGGLAQRTVDLPSAGITSPGVRNFQCWFRDPAAGGTGFNTSDALAITFVP